MTRTASLQEPETRREESRRHARGWFGDLRQSPMTRWMVQERPSASAPPM